MSVKGLGVRGLKGFKKFVDFFTFLIVFLRPGSTVQCIHLFFPAQSPGQNPGQKSGQNQT